MIEKLFVNPFKSLHRNKLSLAD